MMEKSHFVKEMAADERHSHWEGTVEEPFEVSNEQASETPEGDSPVVTAENLTVNSAFVMAAEVHQDMTMTNSGAFAIEVGRDAEITDGGAMAITTGGNVEIMNGGAFALTVGGNAEISNGGAWMAVIGNGAALQNSAIGLLISNQTTLESGSKVLMETKQAVALGAAMGAVFALVSWLLRRR